jgi:hypothetical protein
MLGAGFRVPTTRRAEPGAEITRAVHDTVVERDGTGSELDTVGRDIPACSVGLALCRVVFVQIKAQYSYKHYSPCCCLFWVKHA